MRQHYKHSFAPLLILLFWLPATGWGQSAQRALSGTQWQQLTGDSAFYYRNELEHTAPAGQGSFITHFINQLVRFFNSVYGHVTIALIAICILVFAVYMIVRSRHFIFKKEKKENETIQEDEDIAATNWEQLFQEATAANDLRLAIRYSYMWLLQLLEKRELIQYRPDKTNSDYYLELAASQYRQQFRTISRQYEAAWYGLLPVSASNFAAYIYTFNLLKKQLA